MKLGGCASRTPTPTHITHHYRDTLGCRLRHKPIVARSVLCVSDSYRLATSPEMLYYAGPRFRFLEVCQQYKNVQPVLIMLCYPNTEFVRILPCISFAFFVAVCLCEYGWLYCLCVCYDVV